MQPIHRVLAYIFLLSASFSLAQQPVDPAAQPSATHVWSLWGLVLDPLGARVPGATVQVLAADDRVLQTATTGPDGRYSLDTPHGSSHRFRLRASAPGFRATLTPSLYADPRHGQEQNITLTTPTLSEQVTVSATGTPTPLAQSGAPITVLTERDYLNTLEIQQPLTLVPGVQTTANGQLGGATSLFLRGGNSEFTKVLLDGVPVNDIGASADLSTIAADGISRVEILRQPNSVLYGSDLSSGVVSLSSPRGTTPLPLITYAVDGGNLDTLHQAITISGARSRLDYQSGFAVLQTSNQTANDDFHSSSSFGNYGFAPDTKTDLRFSFRHIDTNSGVPNAIALYGIPDLENQFYQETFLNGTAQRQMTERWHNLLRYGWQALNYTNVQYALSGTPDPDLFETVGNVVTISGANGYSTTGQAQFDYLGASLGVPSERTTRRSFVYAQTDYNVNRHLNALGSLQYEDEKGASAYSTAKRGNYSYTLQLAGDVKNRFFYVLGSGIEDNALYGKAPHATCLRRLLRRASGHDPPSSPAPSCTRVSGKGIEEPSVGEQIGSLYGTFQSLGDTALIAQYNVQPLGGEYSRTYDLGVEQQFGDSRARLNLSWFHNQFTNVLEYVPPSGLIQIGIPVAVANDPNIYGAYVNSQAYRAEGAEAEAEFRLTHSLFARAGYTYLDAVVQRSFSSDALAPAFNTTSNFSTIQIGNFSPLVGSRPFRRAPHSGYFSLEYSHQKLSAQVSGALVGRRDDSTFLGGFDVSYGNSLLLPNRNLDGAYQRMELATEYRVNSHVTTYANLQNLLNESYFEAYGYPALPFTIRGGFKFSFGGESFRLN